jgi:hypothetical protein
MSWVKIDDGAPDHPKWMELAEDPPTWAACWGLWVACAAYCARQLTDGQVPRAFVGQATPLPRKVAEAAAAALVRVGLWAETSSGYAFHDWLTYNPPAEKVRAKRAAAAERMSRGRKRGGDSEVREKFARTNGEQDAKFTCDEPLPVRESFATPVPVPLKEDTPRAGERDPGGADVVVEHQARSVDVYTSLYEYRRSVVARYEEAGKYVRDLGAMGERHIIERAVWHPQLVVAGADGKRGIRPEAELRHALDMIGAQADEKARAGEDTSWSLLANAWSPEVLVRGLACPDEKTARQRAVKRSRGGQSRQAVMPASQPPASHEDFVREAARKKAEKEAQRAATNPAG